MFQPPRTLPRSWLLILCKRRSRCLSDSFPLTYIPISAAFERPQRPLPRPWPLGPRVESPTISRAGKSHGGLRLQPTRAGDCAMISAEAAWHSVPFRESGVLRSLREAAFTCDSIAARVGRCGQGCAARRSVRLDRLKQVPSYDDCSA